jgi:hypothetical protein
VARNIVHMRAASRKWSWTLVLGRAPPVGGRAFMLTLVGVSGSKSTFIKVDIYKNRRL